MNNIENLFILTLSAQPFYWAFDCWSRFSIIRPLIEPGKGEIWYKTFFIDRCLETNEQSIKVDNYGRPIIWNFRYYLIFKDSLNFKKWIFSNEDVILKDSANPSVILERYKWDTYNLWNLCYQNYKPSIFDQSIYITECDTLAQFYWEKGDFNWYIKINDNLCFVKRENKFKKPELKRCEWPQDPWIYYENCCPFQEYDLLMLIRSKIKSKEIKTKEDMIKFVRIENQKYEQIHNTTQDDDSRMIDFEWISFISVVLLFLIIFIKLFKSKRF